MIQSPDEMREARSVVQECICELQNDGIKHNSSPALGMMVELPAVVSCLYLYEGLIDFVSIGTNDLFQYLLAVDRTNASVASLYQPFHPAVLRALKSCVDSARKIGVAISLCGDMAHNVKAIPFLIGIGINKLSVDPSYLGRVQKEVSMLSFTDAEKFSHQLLNARSVFESLALLESWRKDG